MFSRFFGAEGSEGATAETPLQADVKRKFQACASYTDATIQRGRYGGGLTNEFKRAQQIRDQNLKKAVINPDVIIEALSRLQSQKEALFLFSDLLVQSLRSQDWEQKAPEKFADAQNYTDRYLLNWLRHRYELYRILNSLITSEDVNTAFRASHPDLVDHRSLYIPPHRQAGVQPLQEGEEEEQGDEEDDGFLYPTSPERRKKSVAEVDEDAEAFADLEIDDTEVFAGGNQETGDTVQEEEDDDEVFGDTNDDEEMLIPTPDGQQQTPAADDPPPPASTATVPTAGFANAASGGAAQAAAANQHTGIPQPFPQPLAAAQLQPGAIPQPPLAQLPAAAMNPALSLPAATLTAGTLPTNTMPAAPFLMTHQPAHPSGLPPHLAQPPTTFQGRVNFADFAALSTHTSTTPAIPSSNHATLNPANNLFNAENVSGGGTGSLAEDISHLAPGQPARASSGQFFGHPLGFARPSPSAQSASPAPSAAAAAAAAEAEKLLASGLPPGQAGASDGEGTLIRMYSQSMASTFNPSNIIKQPFRGNFADFPAFVTLWGKCHRIMCQLNFTEIEKFGILKCVLAGPSLDYVKDLPDRDDSYKISILTLYSVYYNRGANLLSIIKTLSDTPKSDGTFAGRQRVHAALISYANSLQTICASPTDIQFAYELNVCSANLFDGQWQKEWIKHCMKRKNLQNPLGADVCFADLCQVLFTTMMEQQQLRLLGPTSKYDQNKGKFQRGVTAATQGRGKASAKAIQYDRHSAPADGGVATPANAGGGACGGFVTGSDSAQGGALPRSSQAADATGTVAAVMKGPRRGSRRGGRDKSTEVIVPCIFCRQNDGQEFRHSRPLTCPRLKNKALSPQEVREISLKARSCRNCFDCSHTTKECTGPATLTCRAELKNGERCGKRHHTVWHFDGKYVTFGKAAAASQ